MEIYANRPAPADRSDRARTAAAREGVLRDLSGRLDAQAIAALDRAQIPALIRRVVEDLIADRPAALARDQIALLVAGVVESLISVRLPAPGRAV